MISFYSEIENLAVKLLHKMVSFDKNKIKYANKNEKFSVLDLLILNEVGENKSISGLDLLKRIEIDRGIVTTSLNHLINLNYIIKEKNNEDKRKYNLNFTKEGVNIFNKLSKRRSDTLEFVLKDMSVNEQKTILKFLSKVNQLTVEKFDS
ncbi:MarR family winged helix-turn-helix transcriptional regulator [Helicovermis profundi]|uniref:HTH-type transcriptional regulator SarZ n=1 Tax=Helicovermis profundi TaxID=3065157 RepID=A0AAU9E5Q8_9FIRM|nr:hypothetical protein HLPR_02680 [Clostridia bacterium S502]